MENYTTISVYFGNCAHCESAVKHILSFYLGFNDYSVNTFENKVILFTNDDDKSFVRSLIQRAVPIINTSGITTDSPVISNSPSDENLCAVDRLFIIPQTQTLAVSLENVSDSAFSNTTNLSESKADYHFYSTNRYVIDIKKLVAVLEYEVTCSRGHYIPAWCFSIESGPLVGKAVSLLSSLRPLPKTLSHLKRVHSFLQSEGTRTVRILLDLCGISFNFDDAELLLRKLECGLNLAGDANLHCEACLVPMFKAISCSQHASLVRCSHLAGLKHPSQEIFCGWPSTFHPDQNIESLLSVGGDKRSPYFSNDELVRHNFWLKYVTELSKTTTDTEKSFNTSCGGENSEPCAIVIISPSFSKANNRQSVLAEAVSWSAISRLDHAVFLAVSKVGHHRNQTRLSANETEDCRLPDDGYICTGCDVYLSSEPCLMCSMALIHSRVCRVFIAKRLPALGGLVSRWRVHLNKDINHHFLVFAPSSIS